jgi:hypothetical protein
MYLNMVQEIPWLFPAGNFVEIAVLFPILRSYIPVEPNPPPPLPVSEREKVSSVRTCITGAITSWAIRSWVLSLKF